VRVASAEGANIRWLVTEILRLSEPMILFSYICKDCLLTGSQDPLEPTKRALSKEPVRQRSRSFNGRASRSLGRAQNCRRTRIKTCRIIHCVLTRQSLFIRSTRPRSAPLLVLVLAHEIDSMARTVWSQREACSSEPQGT
jgi:hypothetical protein